jgi:hypothetical protein
VRSNWSRKSAALLCLLAGSAAAAADMLPLKHGIYVDTHVACKGASNVDTLSYWGKENGINAQRTECHITKLSKNRATYVLNRMCRDISGSGMFTDHVTIKVVNGSSFTLVGDPPITYRYCGPRVQF